MQENMDIKEKCSCQQPQVAVLDINTANQIAAGEVVERPASVVKELVENAIDAGASKIEVTILAGGIEYIRVEDNGCGMTEANARLAILRHATSKLHRAEDLMSLGTLGFRGEALPSIASVSKFTLLTRPEGEDMATSITIDGGENVEVSKAGGYLGTSVIVEQLFFNVPARRKFLKTQVTEARYISELLTKLSLSHPEIRFKLVSNGKESLSTPGDGSLENTIRALYGKSVVSDLLVVDFKDPALTIKGYIGKPTLLKGTRQWQSFYVNQRLVGSKMLAKAIDHAYQSQIPKSGFPFAVLNIKVDTHTIDVNVHPQKSEIKFSDEGLIYRAMFKALTDALTRPMAAKPVQVNILPDSELNIFMKETAPVKEQSMPQVEPGLFEPAAAVSVQQTAKPLINNKPDMFKHDYSSIFKEPEPKQAATAVNEQTDAYKAEPIFKEPKPSLQMPIFEDDKQESYVQSVADESPIQNTVIANEPDEKPQTLEFIDTDSAVATIWPIGQVDKTFIIAQSEETLYLIDQHAAHERILFDKLCAAKDRVPAQQLLMPLYVDLDSDEIAMVEECAQEFEHLGIDAVAAGEKVLRIESLPLDIQPEDAADFITDICRLLREQRSNLKASDLRQEVLHMTACKAAIKAGQLLNLKQMRQLLNDLLNTAHPFTCPHGRPCMIAITSNELYKMFKRTGF